MELSRVVMDELYEMADGVMISEFSEDAQEALDSILDGYEFDTPEFEEALDTVLDLIYASQSQGFKQGVEAAFAFLAKQLKGAVADTEGAELYKAFTQQKAKEEYIELETRGWEDYLKRLSPQDRRKAEQKVSEAVRGYKA